MKLISREDIVGVVCTFVVAVVVLLLVDPTPFVKWRAKRHISAIYTEETAKKNDSSMQWKCFSDLRKLKKRGHYFDAERIFVDAYSKITHSTDESIRNLLSFCAQLLRAMPQNAVIITGNNDQTYPLWFLQEVQDIRYDVLVINRYLWRLPKYREFLWKNSILKNIISKDELFTLTSEVEGSDVLQNLSAIAHRLAQYYSVFVFPGDTAEFPAESLYFIPSAMTALYSAKPMSDTTVALISYNMLRNQNFNYLAENPSTSDDELSKKLAQKTFGAVFKTIMLLHATGRDSLANCIFKRFDSWMMWNPQYRSRRDELEKLFPQKKALSEKQKLKRRKRYKGQID